ncbi:MAG: efflux RND transporter periplasmic adaptor subunit [Candidatus Hydrogenedentes bacterium]|nr:efflux RND transporter periplasmic adaptor subunit [Candidatus Hydrogenedentota bacterium]
MNTYRVTSLALAATAIAVALCGCGKTAPEAAAPNAVAPAASVPPEKRDPNRLWCNEHGVYEDECVICHPEIAQQKEPSKEARDPNRLWCNEHGVYEDECYICHPELKPKSDEHAKVDDGHVHDDRGQGNAPSGALICKEHNLPEAECGNCRPDALAEIPVGAGLKVRFASGAATTKAGVATGSPAPAYGGGAREFLGHVTFNRNRLAEVAPQTAGVVVEVLKDVGDAVRADEILGSVRSPEIAAVRKEMSEAQAQARLAQQTLAREQDLFKREISARQDLDAAQAAVAVHQSAIDEARQHFLSLGLSEEDIKRVMTGGSIEPTLPVRAPFAGTVIARNAVKGKTADAGTVLFQIADLSTMWVEFAVPENQLSAVSVGTRIHARVEAYPGVSFDGEVKWIAPSVDAATRMIQARAEIANPQGLLKDGLFGRVSLDSTPGNAGLTVPETAVQDVDGRPVIFKKLGDDLFETRPVELGAASDGHIVVLAGLSADDRIVTEGSYVVKSELLKARLGAGCTDH